MYPPLAAAAPASHPLDDSRKAIRRAAFDILARREHSQQELIDKLLLKFKKYPQLAVTHEQVVEVVAVIAAEDLQSDSRYIHMVIRGRMLQGHGPLRIAQELKHKGIDASAFESLLNSRGEQWLALAQQAKEKKFGKDRALNQNDKAKQLRFLQYRGFSSEQIRYALK